MAFFQSKSLWVREFAKGVAVLQIDPGGKSVRMSLELVDELDQALRAIEAEPSFRLLVMRSLKPTSFCQGPDYAQWRTMKEDDFIAWAERGQQLWNRLRSLPIPSVAWVQGACLGAGLELALGCDRVIVVDKPTTVLGYTELDVGLLPSWGSLDALARRVGIEKACPVVLTGRRHSAREAVALGIADQLVGDEEPEYRDLAESTRKRPDNAWTRRTWRQKLVERFGWGQRLIFRNIDRVQRRRLPEDLPGPRLTLDLLRDFVEHGVDPGQTSARDALVELGRSSAFDNLLRLHELRDRHRPSLGKAPGEKAKIVGIVGATPLGLRLLLEVTRRGDQAILREPDEARLGIAILNLVKMLNREINEGRLAPQESQRCLSRIRSTVSWKNFEEADLVLDTRETSDLGEVGQHAAADAILAIASASSRLEPWTQVVPHPERLLGIHIHGAGGPGSVAQIRRCSATNDAAHRKLRGWASGLGLVPIAVGDLPGLLLARLWVPAWNEMILLLREGAKIAEIDEALSRFGMGPSVFQALDQMGLDAARKLVEIVREELMPRIPLDPFWDEVAERGWGGRSTNRGFYHYRRRRRSVPNHLLENWLRHESGAETLPSVGRRDLITERVVLLMVNESYRCLNEGRVEAADDLDLAMMLTDWAPHRGGPIRYAHQRGLDRIAADLRRLERFGPRYGWCEEVRVTSNVPPRHY